MQARRDDLTNAITFLLAVQNEVSFFSPFPRKVRFLHDILQFPAITGIVQGLNPDRGEYNGVRECFEDQGV